MPIQDTTASVITPEQLLEHWQGHRRVTRRAIEAFSDVQLRNFSLGGMRPFGEMAMEVISMAVPCLRGLVNGDWTMGTRDVPPTKSELLALWDEATEEINTLWAQVPAQKWQENVMAFGQYAGPAFQTILYVIDNEIHHRGQGFVYLRALGIEPPAFYDRS
ncbi:DinB family protein [Longimicrobium terrae]|uniref:Putative damage-inducible protein DinB n=1 Tax=Longimicrobium terrae TaxID=1639882 RepID=A0A841H469_9BACT|nr:DinB family protein [Longimicrobium terrae]MBB4638599.1 putative damage-inducible protein DinB [Longimicrobium terrae]MBB6072763.1 putative damage-inducible protein DinB [Longimicrobium terrae]NNC30619.1 damage-inducible protein DinB [Longimicrobium terrae]